MRRPVTYLSERGEAGKGPGELKRLLIAPPDAPAAQTNRGRREPFKEFAVEGGKCHYLLGLLRAASRAKVMARGHVGLLLKDGLQLLRQHEWILLAGNA